MRTLSDFGQMHFEWMRAMSARDPLRFDPQRTTYPPIEMTHEEFYTVVGRNYFSMKPQTLYGHPIKLSEEPAASIPLPDRA